MDIFQQRYLKHQERKKLSLESSFGKRYKKYRAKDINALERVIVGRRSQRVFNREPITDKELKFIENAIDKVPSSCDRKAIYYKIIESRDDKELLGGLLVGGTGWIHRADKIILLFADMTAYKNPAEVVSMPFLDTGVIIEQTYLASEVLNIGCCYVNPNIRDRNKQFFKDNFSKDKFTGALVLGKYNKKAIL